MIGVIRTNAARDFRMRKHPQALLRPVILDGKPVEVPPSTIGDSGLLR